MGATVFPHSLASRGPAAALPRACASSSIRINPACVAIPTATAANKPKRPGSFGCGDPPAKRVPGVSGEAEPDARTKKSPRPCPVSDKDPRSSLPYGVQASRVTKNQSSASPTRPSELTAPPKPQACSMRELLKKARLAKNPGSASPPKPPASSVGELLEKTGLAKVSPTAADAEAQPEAIHRREIERRRAEARREVDQMVRTVEFNDPFIDPQDVLK
ncbi:hypothetical protein CFC21_043213 [Triticum aestivum]|uniref:Uncharacterized protein n=3 Tax=Triticum TaxID=4564 RepID=A0A9R1QSJ0_TRITD|nr:hypothetical protein CFC21_043213 [Triticum aestivum]VAH82740.1 unnamed protein product [Triticum turgidum subsp. durum]